MQITSYHRKISITKAVLSEIPDILSVEYKKIPIDRLLFKWWKTGRSSDALRLTYGGRVAFEQAGITSYRLDIDPKRIENIDIFMIELGKKLKCPFYICDRYIEVYDDEVAVLIKLYGSIHDYMDTLKERENDNTKQ